MVQQLGDSVALDGCAQFLQGLVEHQIDFTHKRRAVRVGRKAEFALRLHGMHGARCLEHEAAGFRMLKPNFLNQLARLCECQAWMMGLRTDDGASGGFDECFRLWQQRGSKPQWQAAFVACKVDVKTHHVIVYGTGFTPKYLCRDVGDFCQFVEHPFHCFAIVGGGVIHGVHHLPPVMRRMIEDEQPVA